MIRLLLILVSVALCKQVHAQACKGCDELAKVQREYSAKGADELKFELLQEQGAKVVEKMPEGKSQKLTKEQIRAVVAFMRVALPKDPGRFFTQNIDVVLKANRAEFEKEIRLLPKSEATDILDAVSYAIDTDTINQDPAAGNEKLEAQPTGAGKKPANK